MKKRTRSLLLGKALLAPLLTGTSFNSAQAQEQPPLGPPIVVIGQRSLFGVPAERTLGEEDIAGYGISDVGELIDEVRTENGESADEPVVLVNGKPVASLDDIAAYPAEAVQQVQVLPRGSATNVGQSVTRRAYNIVLKQSTLVTVARTGLKLATEGGWTSRRADLTYTSIQSDRRLNGTVGVRGADTLRENERHVEQPVGSPADLGRFRSLQPWSHGYEFNLNAADRFTPWLAGTLTGTLNSTKRRSLLGLSTNEKQLRERASDLNAKINLALNGELGPWLVNWLSSYEIIRQQSLTGDSLGNSDFDRAQTVNRTTLADSELTATGPLFELPAGSLRPILRAGFSHHTLNGRQSSRDTATHDKLVVQAGSVGVGVEIPITSRNKNVFAALGELTGTVQLDLTHSSQFGSNTKATYGVTWVPTRWLRLFGSMSAGRTPPVIGSTFDPLLVTPGIPFFDPLRDETVLVTQVTGGNAELGNQHSENRRVTANLKPIKSVPLQVTAEYTSVRNRDIITALPTGSDIIFALFPERFTRDTNGVLTRVDIRPVQLAREHRDQLRLALNLSVPFGSGAGNSKSDKTSSTSVAKDEDDEARGAHAPARPNGGSSRRPRLQLNLSHTVLLKNELQIRSDVDTIDLVSPDSIGISGGNRPRHQLEFRLGYSEPGLGVRLTGEYRSKSYLRLVGGPDPKVLSLSPLATISLRAFAEPERFFGARWLKGSRVQLSIVNIANKRQGINASRGETPLAYQPPYRDPLGRTIEFELRKVF